MTAAAQQTTDFESARNRKLPGRMSPSIRAAADDELDACEREDLEFIARLVSDDGGRHGVELGADGLPADDEAVRAWGQSRATSDGRRVEEVATRVRTIRAERAERERQRAADTEAAKVDAIERFERLAAEAPAVDDELQRLAKRARDGFTLLAKLADAIDVLDHFDEIKRRRAALEQAARECDALGVSRPALSEQFELPDAHEVRRVLKLLKLNPDYAEKLPAVSSRDLKPGALEKLAAKARGETPPP